MEGPGPKKTVQETARAFVLFLVDEGLLFDLREDLKKVFLGWRAASQERSGSFSEVLYALSRSLNLCKVRGGRISWSSLLSLVQQTESKVSEDEEKCVLSPMKKWLSDNALDDLMEKFEGLDLDLVLQWEEAELDAVEASFSTVKKLERAIKQTRRRMTASVQENRVTIRRISYDPEKLLGKGSGGTRVFAGWVEKRHVAVKRMAKDMWELAEKEIGALHDAKSDESKHIVSYFGSEQDDTYIYLALSLCSNSLGACLAGEGELVFEFALIEDRVQLLRQLATGISNLHELGVIHRDLTPSNVLLDEDGVVKISDMGLARKVEAGADHVSTSSQGTAGWQPVEVLEGTHQSSSVDVFSFGCLAFYVLTLGKHPFGEKEERVFRILNNKPIFKELHRLQGVLHCLKCPKKQFSSKASLQQHLLSVGHPVPIPAVSSSVRCLSCSQEFRSAKDWEDHEHDVVPHVMFSSEELIWRCLLRDSSKRPSMQHILHHPLFWSVGKRLRFFQMVSDWLKADAGVRGNYNKSMGYIYCSENWWLIPEVAPLLKKVKVKKISGLLRLIRNIFHHFQEDPSFSRFKTQADICEFFEKHFPNLLIETWMCVRNMPESEKVADFAQFYT